jgi:penicillin-binding protein 2
MNLESALCQSCNVYFFQAARTIGPAAIHDWAARFGLGRSTGCGLPDERDGNLPAPGADGQAWYPGTTLQFAIGQASLTVTPLQVARMMAAVANDGVLVTPHFVADSEGPLPHDSASGIELASFESAAALWPAQHIPGLSSETLWRIRAGLRRVVDDPHGTGKRVKLARIAIAGKTGTAEVGGGRPDHAWFAGYAPADDPRVAFVVVLENGGSGGQVAGPVARRFVEAMLETGTLRPDVH